MFEDAEAAKTALMEIAGHLFLDRVVVATFCTQDQLDSAIERNAIMPEVMYPNLNTALVATPTFT